MSTLQIVTLYLKNPNDYEYKYADLYKSTCNRYISMQVYKFLNYILADGTKSQELLGKVILNDESRKKSWKRNGKICYLYALKWKSINFETNIKCFKHFEKGWSM